ncbi:TetR/AcrR family transcriptional regulator [Gordonia sp. CPCC 205515]|uniref:TetR/AcrR family transcriptional regulator n=1 Tax=Gordonia sp. CPCC 205515 TaxID=3140791 RepID=UPI003AF3EF5D
MTTPKLWRGQTLSDRATARREEFVAVAEDMLGEQGAAAVTMRAVVRTANLSPRYFYESFASREELLRAVYDRAEAAMIDRLATIDTSTDTRTTILTALEELRDFFTEDPRRARILLREPLADDVLREHSSAQVPIFTALMAPLLANAAPTPGEEAAWAITSTALSGALVALYLDYIDDRLAVAPDRLVDSAVDLVFAICGLPRTDSGSR